MTGAPWNGPQAWDDLTEKEKQLKEALGADNPTEHNQTPAPTEELGLDKTSVATTEDSLAEGVTKNALESAWTVAQSCVDMGSVHIHETLLKWETQISKASRTQLLKDLSEGEVDTESLANQICSMVGGAFANRMDRSHAIKELAEFLSTALLRSRASGTEFSSDKEWLSIDGGTWPASETPELTTYLEGEKT